jgi:SAM-dependent methyltransferase
MTSLDTDKIFAGSVPAMYESHLVPLIFEHYAHDLAQRVATRPALRVLEIAAGTGVLTRSLATTLPAGVSIVATDLNQPMLELAEKIGTSRPVRWQQADAMRLPFEDGVFDAVLCQFGAMFFPQKATAYAEARRVLKHDGVFIFNVWDNIEENHFAHTVSMAVESIFPHDPPQFMRRTPHGYHDLGLIADDLQHGGFTYKPTINTVAARSQAASARAVAIAFCQGTPLCNEIMMRDKNRLEEATAAAEHALRQRFGTDQLDGKMQAHIVTVKR